MGARYFFRSPRSRLLGIPNALLGLTLDRMLATGLLLGWPPALLLLMMVPALAMSAFLGASLIARHLQCRICWTGHIANAALAIDLAARAVD